MFSELINGMIPEPKFTLRVVRDLGFAGVLVAASVYLLQREKDLMSPNEPVRAPPKTIQTAPQR
jgi:hypothetical protein